MKSIFAVAILLLVPVFAFAQSTLFGVPIPDGFQWGYIPIFALGMIIHWFIKLVKAYGGWSKVGTIFNGLFFTNFTGWFFNSFHKTAIAGAFTAIAGLGAGYGLNVNFLAYNGIAIFVSLAAGYFSDSAFNDGTIELPKLNSTPTAQ